MYSNNAYFYEIHNTFPTNTTSLIYMQRHVLVISLNFFIPFCDVN